MKHASPFSKERPVRNGRPVNVRQDVEGDIKILRYLDYYDGLTGDDLAQLCCRGYAPTMDRIQVFKSAPFSYIQILHVQNRDLRHLSGTKLVHGISDYGRIYLNDIGETPRFIPNLKARKDRSLDIISHHKLAVCQTAAAFETTYRSFLVKPEEIYAHEACKQQTRALEIRYQFNDTQYEKVIPDYGPFGLQLDDERTDFFILETDLNNEGLSNKSGADAIDRKLAGYDAIMEDQTYFKAWGIDNLTVLFTSTREGRIQGMLGKVRQHVRPRFQKRFLFAVFPTIYSSTKQPPHSWVGGTWKSVHGDVLLGEHRGNKG